MASILDDLIFTDENKAQAVMEAMRYMIEELSVAEELDPSIRKIISLLHQGAVPADVFGITRQELNALLYLGCECLLKGQLDEAQTILTQLAMLDPFESKHLYAIAGVHQAKGNYPIAAKIYINSIMFDAANPDGYMRLAECLLAADEPSEALNTFCLAREIAKSGSGAPGTIELANKMIDILCMRLGVKDPGTA